MSKVKYIVRDRESGTGIDAFDSFDEAVECIRQFEEADRKDEIYTPDFYEIYELEEGEDRYELFTK